MECEAKHYVKKKIIIIIRNNHEKEKLTGCAAVCKDGSKVTSWHNDADIKARQSQVFMSFFYRLLFSFSGSIVLNMLS